MEGYLMAQGIKVIPKPFDLDALLAAVKETLQLPRHSAALHTDQPSDTPKGNT